MLLWLRCIRRLGEVGTGDHQTAARILWLRCRLLAAAADVQAVRIFVCTAHAGAGATGNARVTLAAAHGSRAGARTQ